MEQSQLELWIGLGIVVIALVISIWVLKKFWTQIALFIKDTLKEKQSDGYWKWSVTAVITVTVWKAVLISYFYDMVQKGFNEMAFFGLLAVATGAKIASAKAKQIDPLIQPPKDETNL